MSRLLQYQPVFGRVFPSTTRSHDDGNRRLWGHGNLLSDSTPVRAGQTSIRPCRRATALPPSCLVQLLAIVYSVYVARADFIAPFRPSWAIWSFGFSIRISIQTQPLTRSQLRFVCVCLGLPAYLGSWPSVVKGVLFCAFFIFTMYFVYDLHNNSSNNNNPYT